MKKNEILKQLENIPLNKKEIIIINNSSLVMQDIIEESDIISLACSEKYYNLIDWPEKIDNVKYFNNYEISYRFYDKDNYIKVDNYNVMNAEKCLEVKILENKKIDKKLIKDLDLYLSTKDNYRYERKLRKQGIK